MCPAYAGNVPGTVSVGAGAEGTGLFWIRTAGIGIISVKVTGISSKSAGNGCGRSQLIWQLREGGKGLVTVVSSAPGYGRAAGRTAALCQFMRRNSIGVNPVIFLNTAIKWLASENPVLRAMSWISSLGFVMSSCFAFPILQEVRYS